MGECYTWDDGTSTDNGFPVESCDGTNSNTVATGKNNRNASNNCRYFDDGSNYCGESLNGMSNGYGTMTWADGAKHEGYWKNNKQSGKGKYTWIGGAIYEGDFINGKPLGDGKIIFPPPDNGVFFYGRFDQNGKGKFVYPEGTIEGNFVKGIANGQATQISTTLGNFKGIWKDGKWVKGKHTAIDGSIHEGSFTSSNAAGEGNINMKHGFGKTTFVDGSIHKGNWLNNKATGKGKFISKDGISFVGTFVDGLLEGQGTLTNPNGEKYNGGWKDGYFDGLGRIDYVSGDFYVGSFKGGAANGKGETFFIDGCSLSGVYTNWKINGEAVEICPDGSGFVGNYKENEVYGKGTVTYGYHHKIGGIKYGKRKNETINGEPWRAGDSYTGEYSGSKNGSGIVTRKGGIKFAVTCINGKCISNEKRKLAEKKPKSKVAKTKISGEQMFPVASGTGFVVSKDGYIITNAHVINGCNKVKLRSGADEISTNVISVDNVNDLALLKADFKPSKALSFSRNEPEILEEIIVAGYPFGYQISRSIKVTKGIISSLSGIGNNFSQIQIDAAIQPGNSGGPIIDDTGNVVAVAVAKLDSRKIEKDFGIIPENVNFGIKASVVKTLLSSNNVRIIKPTYWAVSKTALAQNIKKTTFFLSCWMTADRRNKMKSTKVMFKIDKENF